MFPQQTMRSKLQYKELKTVNVMQQSAVLRIR